MITEQAIFTLISEVEKRNLSKACQKMIVKDIQFRTGNGGSIGKDDMEKMIAYSKKLTSKEKFIK